MSAAFTTIFTGRCPECGQTSIYTGLFMIREKCDACGVVYQRDPGSWTGATVMAYVLGSVFATLLITVMWFTGDIMEPSAGWIVPVATCVFLLFTFRLVKGFWVGLLYDTGYVFADPPPAEEPASPEDRVEAVLPAYEQTLDAPDRDTPVHAS